ncbi:hypothetical protein MKW94_024635 [Papaver nudicaule]|uniref:Uncharacterized protein n=1 Tax=Papaver nudicaule TaxID=74823 RepID=A0AA41V129_PAPNU|nr:hypothetical protein [Papaver nudicaule]
MNQQSSSDDYPPNSINLKKEEELDWLSKTGGLFERNHSTKPTTPGRTISHSRSTSASQSFFTNLKFSFSKPQPSTFVPSGTAGRRTSKPATSTKSRLFFPKRSRSKSSSSVPLSEPSSPKVSCIGRVRSTKESFVAKSRSFRFRNSIRSVDDESKKNSPDSGGDKPQKNKFWSNLRSVFRIGDKKKKNGPSSSGSVDSKKKKKISKSQSDKSVVVESLKHAEPASSSEPPSLGGLKRFTSGRKSDAWGGSDLGLDDDESGEFDRGSVFSRRGPSLEIDCKDRDWVSGGPASV